MMIALDTSIVDYALQHALDASNDQEVNYICNRIAESIDSMPKPITMQMSYRVGDYLKTHIPDYLKYRPLQRLQNHLEKHLKDFA